MTPAQEIAACCAHIRIVRRQEGPNDYTITREWWECQDCKTEFRPRTIEDALQAKLAEAQRQMDAIAEAVYPHKERPFTYSSGFIVGEILNNNEKLAEEEGK